MKKHLLIVAALGLIPLLAACGKAAATPTPEATDEPTAAVASPRPESEATPAAAPASEEATEIAPEPEAAFPTPHPNPECVAEPIPEDPNIPPVTADEWSKGPDDALVTIVEYADFQ